MFKCLKRQTQKMGSELLGLYPFPFPLPVISLLFLKPNSTTANLFDVLALVGRESEVLMLTMQCASVRG